MTNHESQPAATQEGNQQQQQQPLSPEQIAEQQTITKKQKQQQQKQQQQPQPQTLTVNATDLNNQRTDQNYQRQVIEGQQQQGQAQVNSLQTEQGNVGEQTDAQVATDSQGKVNVSRGIIGLNSSQNNPNKSYITEGTVADVVNPPSRFPNKDGKINPLSQEDLEGRIKFERLKAGMDKERQEQLAIKIRTEGQGFKYKLPEELKSKFGEDPELEDTPDNYAENEANANEKLGEQIINTDSSGQEGNQSGEEGRQPLGTEPQNQQENLKG